MLFALVVVSGIASVALACWLTAELDLRGLERDLAEAERELEVALGWDEPEKRLREVVLHTIEGGDG